MNNMIYVSYSQKDGPIVQRICRSLTEKGIQLFVDYEQMAGGDYAQELIKQIESAEAILFFYSENTENSTWVKHEIEFSLSKNKKIIPLLLSEPKESTWLHFYLESFNWIILDGENINSVADRIIKSLEISSEENCSIPSETLGDVKEDDRTNVPQPKQSNNYDEVPLPKKNHISCGCGIIVILGLIGLFLYFTLFSGSPNSLSYDTVTTSNIDYGQTDSFVLKQREAKLKNLKNRLDELFSGSPLTFAPDYR